MIRSVKPYGDTGVLVELPDLDGAIRLSAAIATAHLPGVVDVVPAARTVLVRLDPARTTVAAVSRAVRSVQPATSADRGGELVEIAVVYDGPDLDEVGALTGLGRDGVVAAHTETPWTVGFCGFSPGFGYCAGGSGVGQATWATTRTVTWPL